ncbi:MAG: peptidoglycan editing factor PgeF [Mogibacterium sp.]|nr:peptidoglycan editing factor PgeF [Mogibacterium sp.]
MRLFDQFSDKIIYSYSTRQGGVSDPPYDTLNLSFSMGDDPDKVRRNHEIWLGSLGVDPHQTVMLSQIHSNHVIAVGKEDCGHGLFRERIPDADGMITNEPGVALVTGHADCVPVYLYDPVREVIGMVHAGWRGTTAEIARVAVELMEDYYGCDPADLYAMIGPCISIKYFECDRDVIDEVEEMTCDTYLTYYYNEFTGKYHVSLAGLNRQVLKCAGVPAEHIDMEDKCTYGNPDLYFSHRRDGMARGGQQALLMLRETGPSDRAAADGQHAAPAHGATDHSAASAIGATATTSNASADSFPTLDEFKAIVAELLDELPRAFFKELSGGVIVSEAVNLSPQARANDLYTLGTYSVGPLGRQVTIFYGSCQRAFRHLGRAALKDRVRGIVRHEFRHHMEFLAGMHGADSLEAADKRAMREYLNNNK